ncbi:MAG: cysteine hydrolase family protein [Nanoarchaeota archaeon]|nr:cysteine hydrolase family protein [Nanoarchaeota archaeon]MBU1322226.1 cysteine hydrolase family protein [Nanoarchaeota archaeon]MBU1597767.1 cysteine hydrolase family protein [Nanoarchaeota archaeon]MBU2442031.1 cysteine hydrolase family protein [Nanoarchaeota archaeon]
MNKEKTIFWNVDTLYDFMRKDGKLYVPGAETTEGNLEIITKTAKKEDIQVINSGDWHDKNSPEISDKPDFVNTFLMHAEKNTPGAEYIPATNPENAYTIFKEDKTIDENLVRETRNIVIRKDAFDSFDLNQGNPHTEKILDIIKPKKVIVYGVATNYCDDFVIMGLAKRKGIEIYAVIDAMKEIPSDGEPQKTFDKWKEAGVKLVTTDEVVKQYQR